MKNYIQNLRSKTKLSRKEMADLLGLSQQAIYYYEHGHRRPRLGICYKLIDFAKRHGVTIRLEDIYPRGK